MKTPKSIKTRTKPSPKRKWYLSYNSETFLIEQAKKKVYNEKGRKENSEKHKAYHYSKEADKLRK